MELYRAGLRSRRAVGSAKQPAMHRPKLLSLPLLLLGGAVDAQKGRPAIPPYPVTYQMNRSTIIMPCNESGLTDPCVLFVLRCCSAPLL